MDWNLNYREQRFTLGTTLRHCTLLTNPQCGFHTSKKVVYIKKFLEVSLGIIIVIENYCNPILCHILFFFSCSLVNINNENDLFMCLCLLATTKAAKINLQAIFSRLLVIFCYSFKFMSLFTCLLYFFVRETLHVSSFN